VKDKVKIKSTRKRTVSKKKTLTKEALQCLTTLYHKELFREKEKR
jgi:hypothetical protein